MSLGVDFEVFESPSQIQWPSLFLLSVDPDVELSVPSPAPCLPAHRHTFHHDDNELNP